MNGVRNACAICFALLGLGSAGCSSTDDSHARAASSEGDGGAAGASPAHSDEAGSAGSGEGLASGPCTPPVDVDAPAEKLSQTGCMDAAAPTRFASLVIPYEVNSPLWSDSADKERGMVVPAGKTVHVVDCEKEPTSCLGPADDGKWSFPVGTVMLKSFAFDGKLVETRLFVHHDEDTWVGYSYQWNEAQTDATLVPDERRRVMFDTGTRIVSWHYPSRNDCMKCHNEAGGSTLGPETRQMNRERDGRNQIDTLAGLGLFDVRPKAPYGAPLVAPYAGQVGAPPESATVEERARSYLHANCAFCHRPDGDFSNLDLRYDTAFADTGLCNTDPEKGDVGVIGATNLKPEQPPKSVLWLRMNALPNEGRMPQIASYRVDTQAVDLVSDWIDSIHFCPR